MDHDRVNERLKYLPKSQRKMPKKYGYYTNVESSFGLGLGFGQQYISVGSDTCFDRNDLVFDNRRRPDKFLFLGNALVEEFMQKDEERHSRLSRPLTAWKAPEVGWVKINTDAACNIAEGMIACGVVARDNMGRVLKMGSRFLQGVQDVEAAELHALRFGMEIAIEAGFSKAHFESDALLAINRVRDLGNAIDQNQLIADDIVILGSHLDLSSFSHIRREGNRLACYS
ncbi:uncharacterized protein LOC126672214 [Mercurialis annua]|uniref:uncharacterized protein LOC126672214 n=1 Tax=Mercurialis annua TaxID=3986 RepID=UPI00215EFD8F|nr:uncharacterized protein LOC126672214 [Mercurialis annua]